MAGELPSYVVRNLIDSALTRNEVKTTSKLIKTSLCVAIPTERNYTNAEATKVEEIKSLLKLHKQFEDEALRKFHKGVVEKKSTRSTQAFLSNGPDNSSLTGRKMENHDYFMEISSKLADQVQFPDFTTNEPVLSSSSGHVRSLRFNERKLQSLTYHHNGSLCGFYEEKDGKSRPNSSPENWYFNKSHFHKENALNKYKRRGFTPNGKNCHLETLPQLLTVVPLSSETFAAYDSLPTFIEDVTRYNIGSPRNSSESPVLWLVPVEEARSEDAISVNFEKYLRDDGSRGVDDGFRGGSRALVEYKPVYRKNVHFSENLHEVHLYSPVQNHRSRRRRRRRHPTEEES